MVQLDVTIVNVALPTIANTLGASVAGLQWVVDAYTLFATLLLSAGVLGDLFGKAGLFGRVRRVRRGLTGLRAGGGTGGAGRCGGFFGKKALAKALQHDIESRNEHHGDAGGGQHAAGHRYADGFSGVGARP